ncbi:MAG TPA: FAD-dependent oxidoreductase [Candidatus Acidoferrales bacterium]
MMTRQEALKNIAERTFDVCIIGGGATGAGSALDAQLRGLKTVLLDAGDFGGGASTAATKIIHGGVRYLEEAVKGLDVKQYEVVNRALHERVRMLRNAPFLAHPLEFLIPCRNWFEVAYMGFGMKLYEWIAGKASLFASRFLSQPETLKRMPGLASSHLLGSIAYADGQFDDARYNLALVNSFAAAGGVALNYARVTGFEKDDAGKLRAAQVEDLISQERFVIRAQCLVNATGPGADTIRTLATPRIPQRMRLSKGAHIVLPLDVFPTTDALLVPKTEDGRVMFAVPWFGRLLIGTTEEEVTTHDELYLSKNDVAYLLRHINKYFAAAIGPEQIVSGFAGARPLVSAAGSSATKKLARDHEVEVDQGTGLISIMGGKWTTHRAMAEDTINAVEKSLGLQPTPGVTVDHPLYGAKGYTNDYPQSLVRDYGVSEATAKHLAQKFGTAAPDVLRLAEGSPRLLEPLTPNFAPIGAEVVYCARNEMATTIEDVLMRRTGLQFFSWEAAIAAAPRTGDLLGEELAWTPEQTRTSVDEYVRRIRRLQQLAGFATGSSTAS